MCGIIAITTSARKNVSPMITAGLKRLEYRGYDSVGVSVLNGDGQIETLKDKGTIDQVSKRMSFTNLEGQVGIGHTRWATHGPPNQINAHPHSDCTGKIVLVHNGIIENYMKLKKGLLNRGHEFVSDTDTEVICHLLEEALDDPDEKTSVSAFKQVLAQIEGTYALVWFTRDDPETIFLARKDSPLVIGVKDDTKFAASDIPAFLEYTKRAIVLKNGEIATITPQTVYIEKGGYRIQPKPVIVTWTAESAQKSGYPHYMLKEIHEQPLALKNTLLIDQNMIESAAKMILDADQIAILACGTSYHAGLSGYHYLQPMLKKKPIFPLIASEYETYSSFMDEDSLILAISQSGETLDVMKAVSAARKAGASVVTVANVIDSSIPRMSHVSLYTKAGPEIGVAATKTHTAQIALLGRLGLQVKHELGLLTSKELIQDHDYLLQEISKLTRTVITQNEFKAKELAGKISNQHSAYFLARGASLPVAMEGALKLKEISYIHAEAFPAGESKHGPIAIVEPTFPVILIAPDDWTVKKIVSNAEEMRARGGHIISVAEPNHPIIERSDFSFVVPNPSLTFLRPILDVIPLQMLSYYAATSRGYDPDKPKNLAKTVTVE
ncbi:MAG: glutamine--fructose-6-phosphate transaminase (isomerizing) [Candidatus Thorarchaeota archaeon]